MRYNIWKGKRLKDDGRADAPRAIPLPDARFYKITIIY
jgi:hypothetical protein